MNLWKGGQGKPLWRILPALIIAGLLMGGLANLLDKSELVVASELGQLIEKQAKESVKVTVEGQQYYIVTLKNYINPATLELSSTDSTVKVYVDANWEPISDPVIAQKISRIDFARRLQPVDISRYHQEYEG